MKDKEYSFSEIGGLNPLLNKIGSELHSLFNEYNHFEDEKDFSYKAGQVHGMLRALRTIGIRYRVVLEKDE